MLCLSHRFFHGTNRTFQDTKHVLNASPVFFSKFLPCTSSRGLWDSGVPSVFYPFSPPPPPSSLLPASLLPALHTTGTKAQNSSETYRENRQGSIQSVHKSQGTVTAASDVAQCRRAAIKAKAGYARNLSPG